MTVESSSWRGIYGVFGKSKLRHRRIGHCISDPRGNHSITTTITVRAGIHTVKLIRELSDLSLPQNAAQREQTTRTRRQGGRAENDL